MFRWGRRGRNTYYSVDQKTTRRKYLILVGVVIVLGAGLFAYTQFFSKNTPQESASKLEFDNSVAPSEQERIKTAITNQSITYSGSVTASATSSLDLPEKSVLLEAYVPVTGKYSVRQSTEAESLRNTAILLPPELDQTIRDSLASTLNTKVEPLNGSLDQIAEDSVAFIPASQLSPSVKLLAFNGKYYLDDFNHGAVFRNVSFGGLDAGRLSSINLGDANKESVLTVNQTGVTALTRKMMPKLSQVGDPTFFSKEIGPFLAGADITHVSNEVSFQNGCQYHAMLFCSPPEFIETLKHSGVDVVEITGNHNNDVGRQHNTETINLYHQLGWATVGGGLNAAESTKPYTANKKDSQIAILAYNYPDSPNGGAIASESGAGANRFDFDRIKSDIESAKSQGAQSVIVDVQFWECYAYPDGYVEYPTCDQPIPNQKEVFRKIVDLGADMVVGTSAHQPQTYEFYNGKPIYYGLGNLFFDQTQWPGTERGIILTHYYHKGKLLQTKLTPTVYDKNFQVRIMDEEEANYQLERLHVAR